MQTLTPQELETARTLRLQGRSTDEVYNYIAGNRVGAPSRLSAVRQERVVSPSTGQDILGDVIDFGKGVGQAFKRVVPEVREAFTTPDIDVRSRVSAAALDVAQVPLDIAGEAIIGAGKAALPQSAEDAIKRTFNRGVQGAMESDFAKNTMGWYEQQSPEVQFRLREILLPGVEVAAELGSGGVLGKLFSRGRRQVAGDIAEELQNVAREAETGNIAPANRVVQSTIDDAERERIVTDFTNAYQNSLVENRTAINRQLDKLADQSSFGDVQLTRDELIRNLAEEGYIPSIEGRLAKFDNTFADIENRQDRVMQALMPVLENTRTTVQIEDFFEQIRQSLRNDARVGSDINVALQRIDALEEGARANYGDTLSAVDINRLKIEGNQKRGDVGRASNDPVVTDVWSNVARTANQWIDQNIPDNAGKRANAEWARLQRIKDTAQILNNQQVDVGIFGRALGSYITTVLGSTAGLSVAGPGGLVIAGVLSNIGADTLANLIRNRTFNPKVAEQVRNVMRQDDELVEDLIRTANDQDTEIIRRFLLPAADPNAPRSQVSSGAPIQLGGDTPKGRVEPGITERTREGAIRQPEGERVPTEVERAIQQDRDALEQAIMEMEVEANALRGENTLVKNADGQYYRFKTIPSWVPDNLRDGNNLEKAIKNIEQGKKPREDTKVAQLQQLVQEHIDKRVAEIKAADTTLTEGVFSNDTAFAIALLAGGTYYLSTTDGEGAPILAAAAFASPAGRKALAKQGGRVAKMSDDMAVETLDALKAYDATPLTTKVPTRSTTQGSMQGIEFGNADAEVRLTQLQAKNEGSALSNAELVEARALLEQMGAITPFAKPATTKTTDLLEEARKYDSAEEFVKKIQNNVQKVTLPAGKDRQFISELYKVGDSNIYVGYKKTGEKKKVTIPVVNSSGKKVGETTENQNIVELKIFSVSADDENFANAFTRAEGVKTSEMGTEEFVKSLNSQLKTVWKEANN